MIGQIRGIVLEKAHPQLLIDVHGIGYEIDAPTSTFDQLPAIGQKVILFTHFVVREDAQQLYGFYTRDERLLFRTLLKVNGVGPRLALGILSSLSPQAFVQCVLNNDTAGLVQLPGIGKKTAERLVIEMRDKLKDWHGQSTIEIALPEIKGTRHHILKDAISALQSLGYKPQEANKVITKVDDGQSLSEELIRRALREMA
jgi:holliday junction DNA helicase RuvA